MYSPNAVWLQRLEIIITPQQRHKRTYGGEQIMTAKTACIPFLKNILQKYRQELLCILPGTGAGGGPGLVTEKKKKRLIYKSISEEWQYKMN